MTQRRGVGRHILDLGSPDIALDSFEIFSVCDLLVSQELGPRPPRCICEVVDGPLSVRMPTSGWLIGRLPKKGISRVAAPKDDHLCGAHAGEASCQVSHGRWSGIVRVPVLVQDIDGGAPFEC